MSEVVPEQNISHEGNESIEEAAPARSPIRRFIVLGVLVAFIAILGVGLFSANQSQPQSGPAPDFTLTLFDGYQGNVGKPTVSLSELRGKVVLINFWASWCIPCADEAPELEAAYEQYKDRGVVFLGIGYLDNEADARNYMKRFGITYANGPDLRTKISPLYYITGVPETYIIDKQGNIRFTKIMPVVQTELAQVFERLLK